MTSLIASPYIHACIVCEALPMHEVLVEELDNCRDAALAVQVKNGGKVNYKIVQVLKTDSHLKSGSEVFATLPLFSDDAGKMGHETVLLTREGDHGTWIIRAPAEEPQHVELFKKVLLLPEDEDDARASFFVQHLHHNDPLLARVAATEMSNLPYASLGCVKKDLRLSKIRESLNVPGDIGHRAIYYTLLGMCGEEEDAESVEEMIHVMLGSNSYQNLAAVLTAHLEFKGNEAVKDIETLYFKDENRTLPELSAAVRALSAHGATVNEPDKVSRKRVLEAYQGFLVERGVLIRLVIEDLTRWRAWQFKSLVKEISKQGEFDAETDKLINNYLAFCK